MSYQLTPFDGSRWVEVAALADTVVPFDKPGNLLWVRNRQSFPEQQRQRRHYGVVDSDGALVGYASVEEQAQADYGPIEPSNYRLFIVPASDEVWQDVGKLLYDRLFEDAVALGARRLFLREHARDSALLSFFSAEGFAQNGVLLDSRAPETTDVSTLRPLVHYLEVLNGEHCLVCPSDAHRALALAEALGFKERFRFVVLEKRLAPALTN